MEQNETTLTAVEEFRKAKIEHFLALARDEVAMGRILAARGPVGQALAMNGSEEEGLALKREIDEAITQLARRANHGSSNGHGSNGTPKSRRRELIMLVDQDEQLLGTLACSFRRYGFTVVSAVSYDEAVESITLFPPDVIISEVNFASGSKGFDLFRWTRTNIAVNSPLFFFLATRIDRETVIAGKRFGVEELIAKPVDNEVVVTSVVSALTRHASVHRHR
jgi:CheY-like chemotaxis protein